MNFVIDRTSEDIMYAQSFLTTYWNILSNEQKQEWLTDLKGFFNHSDMTRIKDNYNSLRSTYSYTSQDEITTNFGMSTIPILSEMNAHFEKVRQFGIDCLPYFVGVNFIDYRTPNTMTSSVNKIDFNFLNDYEHILKNLYDYNTDSELLIECDYDISTNDIEMSGYLKGSSGKRAGVKIPSGYVAIREIGTYADDTFTVGSSTTFRTNGEFVEQYFSTPNIYYNLKINSGVQNNNIVMPYRISPTIYDVTNFDTVILDCDLILYNTTTNYTASAIQSNMIDVRDKTSLYLYNASDYSGNIIITTYDEMQDDIDEFALTEDMQIDLTSVSYFTIDSEVGDTLTYLLSSGSSIGIDGLKVVTDTTHPYTIGDEIDVSGIDTLRIRTTTTTTNQIVLKATKSINGGKDISQLDTDEIELKYV